MEQISDFTIQGFRGLRNLKIEKLGQINLFVGNNNSGKTSVLEALALFCDPFNGRKWYDAGQREGTNNASRSTIIDRIIWLFPQTINEHNGVLSENAQIVLSATGKFPIEKVSASYEAFSNIVTAQKTLFDSDGTTEGRDVEVEGINIHISANTSVQPALFNDFDLNTLVEGTIAINEYTPFPTSSKKQGPTLPVQVVNPFSHRNNVLPSRLWSDVVEADLKSETIELLRFFDPAIQDVDIVSPTERRQFVSVKHKKLGRAPLYTFGDGLRRVFTLATSIPRVKDGLLLVDELETAIHTRALEKTFDWLVNACIRNHVQLITTTHSLEALDAILEVSREKANLVAYRLQQEHEQTMATRFDKEITLRLREDLGMDVRV